MANCTKQLKWKIFLNYLLSTLIHISRHSVSAFEHLERHKCKWWLTFASVIKSRRDGELEPFKVNQIKLHNFDYVFFFFAWQWTVKWGFNPIGNWLQFLLTKISISEAVVHSTTAIFVTQIHGGWRRKRKARTLISLVNHLNWKTENRPDMRIVLEGKCGHFIKMLVQHEAQHETFLSIGSQPWLRCLFHANLIIVIDSGRCGFIAL